MQVKPGIYRHYKGNDYRVHWIARHSETQEDYVVYEPLYESVSKFWIRPVKMFLEEVQKGETTVPRFKFIKEK